MRDAKPNGWMELLDYAKSKAELAFVRFDDKKNCWTAVARKDGVTYISRNKRRSVAVGKLVIAIKGL